jgi:hypothetical protein
MDASTQDTRWDTFCAQLAELRRGISRSISVNINIAELRNSTKEFCRFYFRQMRPSFVLLEIEREFLSRLDRHIYWLLQLSSKPSAKSSYLTAFTYIDQLMEVIGLQREI